MNITMEEIKYIKKPGTKTVWIEKERITREISEEYYENMTGKETQRFFRRLGGIETAIRCYTSQGYKIVELVSTSPDREIKRVRKFDFEENKLC